LATYPDQVIKIQKQRNVFSTIQTEKESEIKGEKSD
jgi:hypothetical protein